MSNVVIFSRDEVDLIAALAGCSLDESPGSNWVQDAGGLPEYICEVARAIKRSGKSTSSAIAIAVSRIKKWAAGIGVDKDTQAKAAKALAEWEAKRVKHAAKKAGRKAAGAAKGKDDKASMSHVGSPEVLMLAKTTEYNVAIVSDAWQKKTRAARDAYWKANPSAKYDDAPASYWIKEQWTSFIIVSDGYGDSKPLYKVPYTVDADLNVTFEDPQPVKTEYVAVADDELDDTGLSDATLASMANTSSAGCMFGGPVPLLTLTGTGEGGSALDRVLAFANDTSKPYGDVTYADPGYKEDKKRYPIDTAAHVRSAWSYINQAGNQKDYTAAQIAAIKGRIKAAAKKLGVDISED